MAVSTQITQVLISTAQAHAEAEAEAGAIVSCASRSRTKEHGNLLLLRTRRALGASPSGGAASGAVASALGTYDGRCRNGLWVYSAGVGSFLVMVS